MTERLIHKHVFSFNNTMHGGLMLVTEHYDNGDGEIFTIQKIVLSANCNQAEFHISDGQMTADKLRKLANELDVLANVYKEGAK